MQIRLNGLHHVIGGYLTARHALHSVKNSHPSDLGSCTDFFALPLANPSVLFFVMLFVPSLIRHIVFCFLIVNGLKVKSKIQRAAPALRQKDPPKNKVQSYINITASYSTAPAIPRSIQSCPISQLC